MKHCEFDFLKLEDLQIVMLVVATESHVSWPVSRIIIMQCCY